MSTNVVNNTIKYVKENGPMIGVSLGGSILGSSILGFIGIPFIGAVSGAILAPIVVRKFL